ncbi:DUF559 domain-containing protein, partial [Micromonospora echinofusca]|uniref:DUF559 domain-containing protein n=1 Tax=Micromonospora echinofusca TaxID=47858 RepID=UPI001FCDF11B
TLGRPLPRDDADELTWLLFHQDQVISLAQALRHMSRRAVRHRLATDRWRQVHRAVFVTHNGPIGPDQFCWIAVLAAGEPAVLAGLTAAREWGLRRYDGSAVHLLLPAARRADRLPPYVVAHRSTSLPEEDVLPVGLPPRTMPARSIVDAAQWARTDEEARAVVAAGFQQRLVGGDDIHRVLDRMPRARRRKLIMQTATDAAGGAHSLAELDFLSLVRRAGLPEPSRQVIRTDSAGRRRYLDVYFDRWRVHVEVDGGQHLDPRTAWADMQRQNDLWIAGDRVLRFPAWAVRNQPGAVIQQLRAALRAAGWPG